MTTETVKIELVKPQSLQLHPDAGEVLEMPPDQYKEFLKAVKSHGVIRKPLERLKGTNTLIDGRTRRQAAIDAGFAVVPVIDVDLGDEDPVLYMLSSAKDRRHLTPGQRAAQGAKYLARLKKVAKERQKEGGRKGGQAAGRGRTKQPDRVVADVPQPKPTPAPKSRDEAARLSGSSPKAVAAAAKVQEKAPEVFDQLAAGKIELPEAKKAAGVTTKPKTESTPKSAKSNTDAAKISKPLAQIAGFPAALASALELIHIRTDILLSEHANREKGSHEERIKKVLGKAPGTYEDEIKRGATAFLDYLYPGRKKKSAEEDLQGLGLLSKPELLPCPFCGTAGDKLTVLGQSGVTCHECGAMGPIKSDANAARNAWNKRATTREKGGPS